MKKINSSKDQFFNLFDECIDTYSLPENFSLLIDSDPHPLCAVAANELQHHLRNQQEWSHNFGLKEGAGGSVIGKMFGVLVVQTSENEIGYLAAFSGKMAGGNHHSKFVPPVFDSLTDNSFLNNGMKEISRLSTEIKEIELLDSRIYGEKIIRLKENRKNYSNALQHELFNNYIFLNYNGERKSLYEIFKNASYKNPPAGAGECAGPKLLQYAFLKSMKPLALAEFWWGQSPKSNHWKHGHYYPCCREKCTPILSHMLTGLV